MGADQECGSSSEPVSDDGRMTVAGRALDADTMCAGCGGPMRAGDGVLVITMPDGAEYLVHNERWPEGALMNGSPCFIAWLFWNRSEANA